MGKILVKKATLSNDEEVVARAEKVMEEAHAKCRKQDGSDDTNFANQLLDIYAMKLSIARDHNDKKRQKVLFDKALPLTEGGLGSVEIIGSIFEMGGRSRLEESRFEEASKYLFEAFGNYDNCGRRDKANECLKFYVFATLLSNLGVNPFDDPKITSYKDNRDIKYCQAITQSYLTKNLVKFDLDLKFLDKHDPILEYAAPLKKSLQKNMLLALVKPYSNISLSYCRRKLKAGNDEAESLLVELILDRQIKGVIDESAGILFLEDALTEADIMYRAIKGMTNELTKVTKTVFSAVN